MEVAVEVKEPMCWPAMALLEKSSADLTGPGATRDLEGATFSQRGILIAWSLLEISWV